MHQNNTWVASRFERVSLVLAACFSAACSTESVVIMPAGEDVVAALTAFRTLGEPHRLRLASRDEPGRRLAVLVTVIDSTRNTPASGRAVVAYHTAHSGSYEESVPGVDSTARLRGSARTDPHGRLLIETILPGAYGSNNDQRHIHTRIPGATPDAYDILFSQYVGFAGRRWANRSGQAFIGTLYETDAGLVMPVRVVVRGLNARETEG